MRRSGVPMAYSAGFSPHPKISYANAAPTGTASEAEYLEIGVAAPCDPADLRDRLDAALPPGLDVLEVVEARTPDFVQRLEASRWRLELRGLDESSLREALDALLAAEGVEVERLTKNGLRRFEVRPALLDAWVTPAEATSTAPRAASGITPDPCAILHVVLRQATPAVRPDDVLAALRSVAGLVPPVPPLVTREAQGPLAENGNAGEISLGDPLAADREA